MLRTAGQKTRATRRPKRRAAALAVPKTEKGRRTRERLIAGAAAALGSHGYEAVRVDQIAAEAGVPVGLFYRYFRDKHDITNEVLRRLVAEFRASIPQPGASVTLWERELALHRNFGVLFGQGKTRLMTCYFTGTSGDQQFAAMFAAQQKGFVDEHVAAIRKAKPPGSFPAPVLPVVVHALMCMTESFLYRFFTGRESSDGTGSLPTIDIVWLTAALRYRGFALEDPPRPVIVDLSWLRARRQLGTATPALRNVKVAKWTPPSAKRSDSQQSLAQLLDATRRLLNTLSYEALRIQDIESASGLTRGGIYHHFRDKRDLVCSVLMDKFKRISSQLVAQAAEAPTRSSAFARLLTIAIVIVEEFSADPGALRAWQYIEDRDRDFARSYRAERAVWQSVIADTLSAYLSPPAGQKQIVEFMSSAFVAMAERFVYDVYVVRFASADLLRSPRDVAELVATLWYRMAFRAHPEESTIAGQ